MLSYDNKKFNRTIEEKGTVTSVEGTKLNQKSNQNEGMIKTLNERRFCPSTVALAFLALQTSASELEEVRQAVATTNSILAETYYFLTIAADDDHSCGFLAI